MCYRAQAPLCRMYLPREKHAELGGKGKNTRRLLSQQEAMGDAPTPFSYSPFSPGTLALAHGGEAGGGSPSMVAVDGTSDSLWGRGSRVLGGMAYLEMSPAAALSPEKDGPKCGCSFKPGDALPLDATFEPKISTAQLEALPPGCGGGA